MAFSSIGLFIATISRNSPAFQTFSSMIMMPLTFLSGAYIPTTVMPKVLLPIVYVNPLTYATSIFRYISLDIWKMSANELVKEGMAFDINGFIITPILGLIIIVIIGSGFCLLCVRKFNQADWGCGRFLGLMPQVLEPFDIALDSDLQVIP